MGRWSGNVSTLRWQAAPGLRLPYKCDDILEMLANLLDNACKWVDSHVELSIAQDTNNYYLRVDDDGPGSEKSQREQVQQRGSRLDEPSTGYGLGLGIVRDIVDTLQGSVQLLSSPSGVKG